MTTKKIVFILVLLVFIGHLLFRIYDYRNEYLTPYNAKYWEDRYNKSQWVIPNSKESIGDDGLYTYAGWEYIHGRDPTTLNAELPPFGKYLIGASEIIFNNQNIFALLSGLFVLVGFYLFSLLFFKDKIIAFLPVAALSFEPLFYTQIRAPFLDLLYLGLLLMTFYFFLKKHYAVSGIFLGLMAATKSAASTFPLVFGVMLLTLFLTKQTSMIKRFLIVIPVSVITFLLTYFQFFLQGNSLLEFLGVQKYIVTFYSQGAQSSLVTPWEILFTGKWHTWWGEYATVTEWHIGWPVLVLLSIFAIAKSFKERINEPLLLASLWLLLYILFLSFIPAWPRYLLLILPFMYNLAIWSLFHFIQNKHGNAKVTKAHKR